MIRFAIVGCGKIAQKHAALCNLFGKLVAVCDIDPDRAMILAKKYGANSYHSLEELLKVETDLTVLVICTPNGLHHEHTILGFDKGLHIICEKPMAIEVEDARKMIDASAKARKELFIIKQNRLNPAVLEVRELLDGGFLGKIYSIQVNAFWNRGSDYFKQSWHGDTKLDGGTLFTQFSHFIDLIYWIFGDVEKVSSYKSNFHPEYEKDFEDCLVACFVMKNGALGTGHFTINSYKENMEGSLTVFGENGTIKIGGRYLNEISYQLIKEKVIENIQSERTENDYGSYKGSMSNHDKVYEHIVRVLSGDEKNLFTGQEGLKTVEIIQKIYQAAG